MRRKQRGSIHHPVCLRPSAINNTLLVVPESICRSLAQFKAITTNKRNGTTRSLFRIICAVTRPCEHNPLDAFSIHSYLTAKEDFISIRNLASPPLLQEKQLKPRKAAPNSYPARPTIRVRGSYSRTQRWWWLEMGAMLLFHLFQNRLSIQGIKPVTFCLQACTFNVYTFYCLSPTIFVF